MIRRLPLLGGGPTASAAGDGHDRAGAEAPRPPARGVVAVVSSVLLHVSGVALVGLGNGGAALPDDRPPALVEMALLAPPAPRVVPEPAGDPGAPAGPAPAPAPRRRSAAAAEPDDEPTPSPTPPIATTPLIAATPPPSAPPPPTPAAPVLDFTGAGDIAAGARTATGGSARPGSRGGPGSGAEAGGGTGHGTDLRRPVRLPARNWRCPWPPQANALHIDEQTVVLRVDVDARGRVQDAALLRDPGNGFGTAALRCARDARFTPARDAQGRPIPARSPPIRVRFTR